MPQPQEMLRTYIAPETPPTRSQSALNAAFDAYTLAPKEAALRMTAAEYQHFVLKFFTEQLSTTAQDIIVTGIYDVRFSQGVKRHELFIGNPHPVVLALYEVSIDGIQYDCLYIGPDTTAPATAPAHS